MRPRLVVVVAALAACSAACSLLLGLEEPEGTAPPAASEGDAAAPSDPCAHAGTPARPETDEAPGMAVPPFWLAMRAASAPARTGLDLDGVCTCSGGPGAIADGGATCTPRGGAPLACDAPEGVDDALRGWLATFPSTSPIQPEAELARAVARGESAVLLQIEGYNGLADDRSVTVGFAISDGLFTTACDPALAVNAVDAGCEGDSGFCAPTWRGCDRWHPAAGHVTTSGASLVAVRRAEGWVRGGVLVVRGGAEMPLALVPDRKSVV